MFFHLLQNKIRFKTLSMLLFFLLLLSGINHAKATLNKQNPPVFVRGEISSMKAYVQSQVLYTFKLYFRMPLTNPNLEMPQIKDVTFVQFADRPIYQTNINGEIYHVAQKTFAAFPKKPGVITLPAFQFHALTMEDNSSLFLGSFNVGGFKMVSSATKVLRLIVQDIPADYQGSTWLPAQHISLTDAWSNASKDFELGTPVTRTIIVKAEGLRADQLPDISMDKIDGVNVYIETSKRSNTIQNNSVVGELQQKVTYIPNSMQSFVIPPIKINWWNTKSNTNAMSQLNGMTIQVKPAAFGTTSQELARTEPTHLPNQKNTHQQATPVHAHAFYQSIWFWIACVLFTLWLMTLHLLRKKPISRKDNETKSVTQDVNLLTSSSVQMADRMSEKNFKQACLLGDAMRAKQYLLDWAKKEWNQKASLNLASLRHLIHDESFNLAVSELERALYAKHSVSMWQGESLLASFLRIKKSITKEKNSSNPVDPLPPLHPS